MQRQILAALLGVLVIAGGLAADEKTYRDPHGRLRVRPAPTDPKLNNPWPAEWEDVFATRADHALKYWSGQKLGFDSWGENENASGHYDDVHHVTSAYRPPPGILQWHDATAKRGFPCAICCTASRGWLPRSFWAPFARSGTLRRLPSRPRRCVWPRFRPT